MSNNLPAIRNQQASIIGATLAVLSLVLVIVLRSRRG